VIAFIALGTTVVAGAKFKPESWEKIASGRNLNPKRERGTSCTSLTRI